MTNSGLGYQEYAVLDSNFKVIEINAKIPQTSYYLDKVVILNTYEYVINYKIIIPQRLVEHLGNSETVYYKTNVPKEEPKQFEDEFEMQSRIINKVWDEDEPKQEKEDSYIKEQKERRRNLLNLIDKLEEEKLQEDFTQEQELIELKNQFQIKANELLKLNSKIGNFGNPKQETRKNRLLEELVEDIKNQQSFLRSVKKNPQLYYYKLGNCIYERLYNNNDCFEMEDPYGGQSSKMEKELISLKAKKLYYE